MFNKIPEKSPSIKFVIVSLTVASSLYPRFIDFDSRVECDKRINSSNFPRSLRILPRLEWASPNSGISFIASLNELSALFNLPSHLKTIPRLECTSA